MASPGACDIVEAWLRVNAARLGWRELRFGRTDNIANFHAGYEVPGYLLTIAAWDNASCLDIDVLDTRTKAAQMLCAGPCAGDEELLGRLHMLEAWLADHAGI